MEKKTDLKVEKFTGYSIILWEKLIKEITGEQKFFNYSFASMTEMLSYFYCALYASKKIELTFEEFVAALDEQPDAINIFIADYQKYINLQNQFISKDTDKKKVKKVQG